MYIDLDGSFSCGASCQSHIDDLILKWPPRMNVWSMYLCTPPRSMEELYPGQQIVQYVCHWGPMPVPSLLVHYICIIKIAVERLAEAPKGAKWGCCKPHAQLWRAGAEGGPWARTLEIMKSQ